jgi:hypothetical protein
MSVAEDLSKLSRSQRWKKRHPEKVKAYQKSHAKEREITRIKREYGLTAKEWESILIKQSGRCNICLTELYNKNEPCVDHPHLENWDSLTGDEKKKHIRGMLCFRCNNAIGLLKDDPILLENAIKHLIMETPWQPQ